MAVGVGVGSDEALRVMVLLVLSTWLLPDAQYAAKVTLEPSLGIVMVPVQEEPQVRRLEHDPLDIVPPVAVITHSPEVELTARLKVSPAL
jgi:hypothetical protein